MPQKTYAAEPSPLDIVQQIESNLIYKQDVPVVSKDGEVIIDRGWDAERYKYEVREDEEPMVDIKKTETGQRNVDLERRAYQAIEEGHIEVAIDIYKEILDKDPNNSYALFGLATSYHSLGQYKQAKPMYLKLLKLFPGNEEVMGNLLSIVTEESPYEAVYLLSAMADRNQNSGFVNAQAAIAYNNVGNYSNAMRYLVRALKIEPNNMQYKYNLAVLYDRSERYGDALRLYRDIVKSAKSGGTSYYMPINRLQERINYLKTKVNY